jgi:hypothetical protein
MSTEANDKKTMKDELLSQLHEQYAVNNNANLSSMVTLIVGVIDVIGYYGYVFVHTVDDFGGCYGMFIQGESFTMTTLILTYFSVVCVLAILMRLCIYQGIAQRKEQVIIENIRKHYDTSNDFKNIFPESYTARDKDKSNVIQGLFGEFVKTFRMIIIGLTIITVIRAALALFSIYCTCCQNLMWTVLALVASYFVYQNCMAYWDEHYQKYLDRINKNDKQNS